jgi:hypothetical protein
MRIFIHILVVMGIAGFLIAARRYSLKSLGVPSARREFSYTWPAKIFCIVTVAIFPVVVIDIAEQPLVRGALLVFEVLLVGYVIVVMTTKISLSENAITISNLFRSRSVPFNEIVEIRLVEASAAYVIKRGEKRSIKLSVFIGGINNLVQFLEHTTRKGVVS